LAGGFDGTDPSEPPVFCAAGAFRPAISACIAHPEWSGRAGHCIVIKGQMRFPRFRRAAIQIAIFALAAVLNLYQIGRTSLWNDEGFSFFVAQSEPAHALKFVADGPNRRCTA
jgi:hypothetical protein